MSIYYDAGRHRELRTWAERRLDDADPAAERRTVPTVLGPTHLAVYGTDGPWVVVLPATAECAATSTELVRALAPGHRLAVADVPGEPGLSHPLRPATDLVARYGAWVGEVAAAVSDEPVLLVGEDMGGGIALCAPLERVRGLVTVAPTGIDDDPGDLSAFYRLLRYEWAPNAHNAERLFDAVYGGTRPADHDLLVEWATVVGRCVRSLVAPGLLPDAVLRRWRDVPHRVLVGGSDTLHTAGTLARPVEALMGSAVEVVDGAGKPVTHQAPHRVRDALVAVAT